MNKKFYLIIFFFILLIIFAVIFIILKPKERNLAFETIEQINSPGPIHPYDSKDPGFTIIYSLDEIESIKDLVSESIFIRLNKLNFEENFVIIIFQGKKPSYGYSVKITQVTRSDTIINVYAQFLEPKPNEAKVDEVSSPYQVIQVMKKSENWGQEFIFNLVVDQKIILTIPIFIL
jgi:hypothetical protein